LSLTLEIKKVNNIKRLVSIAICFMLVLSNLAWSEGNVNAELLPECTPFCEYNQAYTLPEVNYAIEGQVKREIKRKNLIEEFSFLFENRHVIKYDDEGRLSKVIYFDSKGNETVATYTYDFKGEELTAITISFDNGAKIEFAKQENGSTKISIFLPQDSNTTDDYGKNDGDGKTHIVRPPDSEDDEIKELVLNDSTDDPVGQEEGDIIIVINDPEFDLNAIAQDPLDFSKFINTINGVDKDVKEAHDEYIQATEPYYKNMLKELTAKADSLKSEGIDLKPYFSQGLDGNDIKENIKRSLIDEAVEYVHYEVAKEEGAKVVAENIIMLEERYSQEFLRLSKDNYESKTEKILEYIQGIIDELLTSKLAVYMNKNKQKIDVIINLPELEEEIT